MSLLRTIKKLKLKPKIYKKQKKQPLLKEKKGILINFYLKMIVQLSKRKVLKLKKNQFVEIPLLSLTKLQTIQLPLDLLLICLILNLLLSKITQKRKSLTLSWIEKVVSGACGEII